MSFLSPSQDFGERTLAALPSDWARLHFIAALGDGSGYSHWGMVRQYGEEATQHAIAAAHQLVYLRMLRAPLARLLEDLLETARAQDCPPLDYLQEISQMGKRLLPRETGGGVPSHFNSIVSAISALLRAERAASHRAA